MATGTKKLKQADTEQPKKAAPPPEKPNADEELRLFQVNLVGAHPETGNPVVHGTEKRWLTRKQAKSHGFHWAVED